MEKIKNFTIALVGRPNVGKSTLFNRLIGKKVALVDDQPGVTRDRKVMNTKWGHMVVDLVDTAGWEDSYDQSLSARMRQQTEAALKDADLILFVFDGGAGVLPMDEAFATILRRNETPVLLCANKYDQKQARINLHEAHQFGLGDPYPISAEHGEGIAELIEAIATYYPDPAAEEDEHEDEYDDDIFDEDEIESDAESDDDAIEEKPISVAIVGRPNAGKSSLINQLLQEDRLLTGPEAGITRDAIRLNWQYQGQDFRLVDTAGLRRRARVEDKLEKMANHETMRAVQLAQVVILVIDATLNVDKQDLTIASYVEKEGRALIIALNKWDLVKDKETVLRDLSERFETSLTQIKKLEVIPISAVNGKNLDRLLKTVIEIRKRWALRFPTSAVNRWLDQAVGRNPPPALKGQRLKFRYATQVKTRPPSLAFFCSRAKEVPDHYLRYLTNDFREYFDVWGIPLRLLLRQTKNPYAGRKKKKEKK